MGAADPWKIVLASDPLRDARHKAHTGRQFLELQPRPQIRDRVIRAGSAGNILHFDPRLALDGGPDGLAAYHAIAADARRLLAPNARLLAETGKGQDVAVASLFAAAGLRGIGTARDLAGISRVVFAIRDPNP